MNNNVITIGDLNKQIFENLQVHLLLSEVVITTERVNHIKIRHPNDYERYFELLKELIEDPDYIIEANKAFSFMLLKESSKNNLKVYAIVRIKCEFDNMDYKNSIITFLKTNDKEWKRILRNKKILYKKNSNGII